MPPPPTPRVATSPRAQSDRQPLRFSCGNAKLDPGIWTFSLPAGQTCPRARECLSKAARRDGTIRDGRETRWRCYAASQEARHPSVRKSRWFNLEQLRACPSAGAMTRLILDSLSPFCQVLRVHDAGDFWSQAYWNAWLAVARERADLRLYYYTKSLRFWVARLDQVGDGRDGELRRPG